VVVFLFNSVIYVSLLLCLYILIICLCFFSVMSVLYSVSLCCFMYCLCVNVYCTTATGFQPNCSNKICHYINKRLLLRAKDVALAQECLSEHSKWHIDIRGTCPFAIRLCCVGHTCSTLGIQLARCSHFCHSSGFAVSMAASTSRHCVLATVPCLPQQRYVPLLSASLTWDIPYHIKPLKCSSNCMYHSPEK